MVENSDGFGVRRFDFHGIKSLKKGDRPAQPVLVCMRHRGWHNHNVPVSKLKPDAESIVNFSKNIQHTGNTAVEAVVGKSLDPDLPQSTQHLASSIGRVIIDH